MKKHSLVSTLVFVLSLACFNPLVFADSSSQNFLLRPWAVGQTATYQIKTFADQGAAVNQDQEITFSIVDKETIDGVDYFWLEIETGTGDVTTIEKLLVRPTEKINFNQLLIGDYTGFNPKRRIKKFNVASSKRLSTVSEFELSNTPDVTETANAFETLNLTNNLDGISVGKTSVPAGDFETQDIHRIGQPFNPPSVGSNASSTIQLQPYFDVALSDKVPILDVVRVVFGFKSSRGSQPTQEIDLISFSNFGALSKVSGKPFFIPLSKQKSQGSSDSNSVDTRENNP